jgi:hypothetical protein
MGHDRIAALRRDEKNDCDEVVIFQANGDLDQLEMICSQRIPGRTAMRFVCNPTYRVLLAEAADGSLYECEWGIAVRWLAG